MIVKSFSYEMEVFIDLLEQFLSEKSHKISQLAVFQRQVTAIFFEKIKEIAGATR